MMLDSCFKSGLHALSMPKATGLVLPETSTRTLTFTAWEELAVPNWELLTV